jgi:hypothetical protein
VTLPSTAYRGHAAPTWDTKTIQQLIDYLQTTTLPVLDGRYARSPLAYFVDVENGDGLSTINAVSNAVWTRINAAGTVWANNGGGWDSSADLYTIPAGGTYYCQALVRLADGIAQNFNLALGIGPSLADGAFVQWNKYFTGAGGRCSFDYTRIAGFAAGQQVQLYCFHDSGVTQNVTRASLQFWRLC